MFRGFEVAGIETIDVFLTESEIELVTQALRNQIDSTRYLLVRNVRMSSSLAFRLSLIPESSTLSKAFLACPRGPSDISLKIAEVGVSLRGLT